MFLESSQNSHENTSVRVSLLKKRLWLRCFSVNFTKFLRTPFSQNSSGGCCISESITGCRNTFYNTLACFVVVVIVVVVVVVLAVSEVEYLIKSLKKPAHTWTTQKFTLNFDNFTVNQWRVKNFTISYL